MRAYALLLGIALTVGYGYAAQVAVASAGFARRGDSALTAPPRAPDDGGGYWPDRVWYGGTLDPITVEASRDAPTSATVTRIPHLGRESVRCIPVAQPRYRITSSGKVRTSMGLVM